jgi:hypothetical protein
MPHTTDRSEIPDRQQIIRLCCMLALVGGGRGAGPPRTGSCPIDRRPWTLSPRGRTCERANSGQSPSLLGDPRCALISWGPSPGVSRTSTVCLSVCTLESLAARRYKLDGLEMPRCAGPRIRPAKVRLNFRLGLRDSGPYSVNYPDLEYSCSSGSAAGGTGWPTAAF